MVFSFFFCKCEEAISWSSVGGDFSKRKYIVNLSAPKKVVTPLNVFFCTQFHVVSIVLRKFSERGVEGWRNGESLTRVPPMWTGLDFQIRCTCHMWVDFVGSLLCTKWFFSVYSGFTLSSKTSI